MQRKSALSMSISIENPTDDEHQFATEWPALSSTESVAKIARQKLADSSYQSCKAENTSSGSEGKQSTTSLIKRNYDNSDDDVLLSAIAALHQSFNLCSPFFKENRGNEDWRDFL